jgi:hypothetical protein
MNKNLRATRSSRFGVDSNFFRPSRVGSLRVESTRNTACDENNLSKLRQYVKTSISSHHRAALSYVFKIITTSLLSPWIFVPCVFHYIFFSSSLFSSSSCITKGPSKLCRLKCNLLMHYCVQRAGDSALFFIVKVRARFCRNFEWNRKDCFAQIERKKII